MLTVEQAAACGVVPVVVLDDAEQAVPTAKALLKGGINAMEITFRTSAAKASIEKVAKEVPEMIVGAGTVVNVQQVHDAVEAGAMDENELKLMENVRKAYLDRTKIGCTGCKYCMPCPNGVNIPGIFSAWNNVSLYNIDPNTDWGFRMIREKDSGADKCIACGACEAACPQHLDIIGSLQAAWTDLTAAGR